MSPDQRPSPERLWLMFTGGVALVALLLPMVPPQAAILAFVGVGMLGAALIGGGRLIAAQLSRIPEDTERSDEPEDPAEAAREAYVEGDLTDAELEEELQDALNP